jgi:hypothetical protein
MASCATRPVVFWSGPGLDDSSTAGSPLGEGVPDGDSVFVGEAVAVGVLGADEPGVDEAGALVLFVVGVGDGASAALTVGEGVGVG